MGELRIVQRGRPADVEFSVAGDIAIVDGDDVATKRLAAVVVVGCIAVVLARTADPGQYGSVHLFECLADRRVRFGPLRALGIGADGPGNQFSLGHRVRPDSRHGTRPQRDVVIAGGLEELRFVVGQAVEFPRHHASADAPRPPRPPTLPHELGADRQELRLAGGLVDVGP